MTLQKRLRRWSKMNDKEIEKSIFTWSERKVINGNSFDDLFQIDGIPLGWFYKKILLPHVVPKHINVFKLIKEDIGVDINDKIKFRLMSFVLRKYMLVNEKNKIIHSKQKKEFSNENKVLFLTYTNHLLSDGKIFRIQNIVDEVKKEFKKDGKLKELVVFADPISSKRCKKTAGLNNLYDYYDFEISKKAKKASMGLFKKWNCIEKDVKKELFKANDETIWPYLKYTLDFYFSREFFYMLAVYFLLFEKVIAKENARAIVLTSQNSLFERCAIAAAKKYNLPSVVIQHGAGLGTQAIEKEDCVKFAVFSELHKQKLIKAGADEKNIFIVGPVILDEIYPFISPTKKNKKIRIFIATSPFVQDFRLSKEEYFRRFGIIIEEIQKIKNVEIKIKLHPREKEKEYYEKLIKDKGYKNIELFEKDIAREKFCKLMQWCNILIHMQSTAAIEAMIIGRPVIDMNMFDRQISEYWLKNKGAMIEAGYKNNLQKTIKKALKYENPVKTKQKESVENYCGKVDGKASYRTFKLIKELVK